MSDDTPPWVILLGLVFALGLAAYLFWNDCRLDARQVAGCGWLVRQ